MLFNDIEIGVKYKIVGNKGGCITLNQKCNNCEPFKKGIIVTKKINGLTGSKNILGKAINSRDSCRFHSNDLELFKIDNWKKVIQDAKSR